MAIPYKEIQLDKPRKLRLGMGAILEFQQLTGIKLVELKDDDIESSLKIIWIMLKQDEPELTLENTSKIIDNYYPGTMETVISDVQEAIQMAFPSSEEIQNPQKPTQTKK